MHKDCATELPDGDRGEVQKRLVDGASTAPRPALRVHNLSIATSATSPDFAAAHHAERGTGQL